MAYVAPSTVITGELITANKWNQDVVDNVQWLRDNAIINLQGGSTNISNTTTETVFGTVAIAGGVLGTEGGFQAIINGVFNNNTTSFENVVFRIKVDDGGGNVTIATLTTGNTGTTPGLRANFGAVRFFNVDNAAINYSLAWMEYTTPPITSTTTYASSPLADLTSTTINTSSDLTVTVTAQLSTASANVSLWGNLMLQLYPDI